MWLFKESGDFGDLLILVSLNILRAVDGVIDFVCFLLRFEVVLLGTTESCIVL